MRQIDVHRLNPFGYRSNRLIVVRSFPTSFCPYSSQPEQFLFSLSVCRVLSKFQFLK